MTENDFRKLLLIRGDLSIGIHQLTSNMKDLSSMDLDKIVPHLKDGLDAVQSLKLIHDAVDRLVDKEVKRIVSPTS